MFVLLVLLFTLNSVLCENSTVEIPTNSSTEEPAPNSKISKFYNCKEFEDDTNYTGNLCTFENYERRYDILPLGNDQITEVEFLSSDVFDIPNTLFKIFPKMEFVNMTNCLVKRLSNTSFSSAGNLKTIVLDDNEVKYLPANAFRGASKVEIIYLGNNQIDEVHKSAFRDAITLEELYLDGNYIESLPAETFFGLEKLSTISLTQNKLKKLDMRAFYKNPIIKEISLDKNFLEKLTLRFRQNSLTSLDISENAISELKLYVDEDSLPQQQIFTLTADNNKIQSFYDVSAKLKIHTLKASNNNIKDFSSILSRSSITVLDLSYTNFGPIFKSTFKNLTNLQELTLTDAIITDIYRGAFRQNQQLWSLNVANNDLIINDVRMFDSAKALKILDISGNIIGANLNVNEFKAVLKNLERIDLLEAQH